MKRNIIYILVGVIVAALMGIFFYHGEEKSMEQYREIEETIEKDDEEMGSEVANNLVLKEYEQYFSNAEFITVSKVVRTIKEKETGESYTSYDEYLVSDVDLVSQKDFTEDYSEAMEGKEFDSSKVIRGTFDEILGFSYVGMNAWDIYSTLLATNGIEMDFEHAIFDNELYDITKQKTYRLFGENIVWKEVLNVEILEQYVSFQEAMTKDGIAYPDCFTAVLRYKEGEWTVTKSLFLQVIVNR